MKILIKLLISFGAVVGFCNCSVVPSKTHMVKNGFAFAVLASDGSVHTWGEQPYGGNSLIASGVTSVVPSRFAFAAERLGGSIISWGVDSATSSDFEAYTDAISGSLVGNEAAFAFLSSDGGGGKVMAFGSKFHGGNVVNDKYCNDYSTQLSSNVAEIIASAGSFAARKNDGSVYAWGNKHTGSGVSTETMPTLTNAQKIVATREAFAVLQTNGSVVTWGSKWSGGDSSPPSPAS
mmetsp:Transcript_24315/g.40492  ORF Transcript_24315/g.40492 Transcript_24315/m.40492 type:complete len:235 (+) Transcript_24315:95-799(+)